MKNLILLISFLTLVLQVSVAQTTKTWTGAAGDNDYYNFYNWDPLDVPYPNDVVIIPSGTSECIIDDNFHTITTVSEIYNYGEITLNNAVFKTDKLHNSNQLNTNGSTRMVVNNDGVFNNEGTIESSGFLQIESFSTVNNSGQMNLNKGEIFANTLNNSGDISTSFSLEIRANKLNNNSTIYSTNSLFDAGDISINTNLLTNDGVIKTGGSQLNTGGRIKILAEKLINKKGAYIVTGNGATPEGNGKIEIDCDKFDNKGTIKAGISPGSKNKERFEIYFNEVAMYADSIFIAGDSVKIEADTMRFVFDYMKLSDIVGYGPIYADVWIEFLATENGVLDLSEGLDQYILSCGNYDGIHFYCNNIIPPPQGISYICDVAANVHPADTTIIQASVSSEYVYDDAGNSGAFYVYLKNMGTGSRAFDYSVSSIEGWTIESSGSTQVLAPFQYDSILINYNIPEGMYSQSDTLTVSLSSGDFSISAQSYIHSNADSTTVIIEPGNSIEQVATVFPNPFRENTTISYTLESRGTVQFDVYDINGHQVYFGKPAVQAPGLNHLSWNASGNQGQKLKAGIYFYRILIGPQSRYSGKLIVE